MDSMSQIQKRGRGRPPLNPAAQAAMNYSQNTAGAGRDPSAQSMESSHMDIYGGRGPNMISPQATVMNYSEYQKLQQMKLEMTTGEKGGLAQTTPMSLAPMLPPPSLINHDDTPPNPFPDKDALPQNHKTDEQFEEEQRKDLMRQEAILAGKRRFKEVRTQLGLDLYNYKNPNLSFLQKLNNLIQSNLPEGCTTSDSQPAKLAYPFRKTFDPAVQQKKSDVLWNAQAENAGKDGQGYSSMRRMKRRIEKEVVKQEMQFHRMQTEVKIKALEAIVKLQGERITRMQAQFDASLAQMVKVLVNEGGDASAMIQDEEHDDVEGEGDDDVEDTMEKPPVETEKL